MSVVNRVAIRAENGNRIKLKSNNSFLSDFAERNWSNYCNTVFSTLALRNDIFLYRVLRLTTTVLTSVDSEKSAPYLMHFYRSDIKDGALLN